MNTTEWKRSAKGIVSGDKMYGTIFGESSEADELLSILNLKKEDVGRFRDAWVTEEGLIAIYTRNGGNNREHWDFSYPEKEDETCPCPGCVITYKLPKHPLFIKDEDDKFDNTYATIYFKPPNPEDIKKYSPGMSGNERWKSVLGIINVCR